MYIDVYIKNTDDIYDRYLNLACIDGVETGRRKGGGLGGERESKGCLLLEPPFVHFCLIPDWLSRNK